MKTFRPITKNKRQIGLLFAVYSYKTDRKRGRKPIYNDNKVVAVVSIDFEMRTSMAIVSLSYKIGTAYSDQTLCHGI